MRVLCGDVEGVARAAHHGELRQVHARLDVGLRFAIHIDDQAQAARLAAEVISRIHRAAGENEAICGGGDLGHLVGEVHGDIEFVRRGRRCAAGPEDCPAADTDKAPRIIANVAQTGRMFFISIFSLISRYSTVSETLALWLNEPEAPVTVMVDVDGAWPK